MVTVILQNILQSHSEALAEGTSVELQLSENNNEVPAPDSSCELCL